MFVYEKKLQYPVKIKNTNPKLAALIISQYGGPYSHKLRKHLPQRVLSCNTAKTNERPPASHLLFTAPSGSKFPQVFALQSGTGVLGV